VIKPEQIPYEGKLRLRAILHDGETDEAKAIAAALNAWPGAQESGMTMGPYKSHIYVLPLPQENNNGSD